MQREGVIWRFHYFYGIDLKHWGIGGEASINVGDEGEYTNIGLAVLLLCFYIGGYLCV